MDNDTQSRKPPAEGRDSGGQRPWTGDGMPCVYCGQVIARGSQRCPQCKTSYSLAVRRASREIEGQWFYLEPRNPSNRGVDFTTMLKLVEKGRLQRDSIVRGPTTHQDWMFAAETPLLSKHLGLCPHCFAPAGQDDQYCPTCHRHLDERPARLRPAAQAPGAEDRFPDRARTEEQLAAALVTHDMARAASSSAAAQSSPPVPEVTTVAIDSGYHDVMSESTRVQPLTRRRRPIEQLRAKPHIVALLTVVTVVPLAIIIMYLPLEYLLGDPDSPGTMAYNFRSNRLSVQALLPWSSSGDQRDPTEDQDVQDLLAEADRARAQGRYETAAAIYSDLLDAHRDTPLAETVREKLESVQRVIDGLKRRRQEVVDLVDRAGAALGAGDYKKARRMLDGLTSRQTDLARKAGLDLMALRERISAADLSEEGKARQKKLRREVQNLIAQAANSEAKGKLKAALGILEDVANKYPREYLPAGFDLDQGIASLKQRIKKPPPPKPPKP
ncbi:MAG: hypothetical protein GWP05_08260, partial [Anaerolineaceae bacterium]|nr:hypothetical protein [Anaerolineaceae bacterium]